MFGRRRKVDDHRSGPVMDCLDCGRVTTRYIVRSITCSQCGAGMSNLMPVGCIFANPLAMSNARRGAALSDDLVAIVAYLDEHDAGVDEVPALAVAR
jgi:ribosomal protein L37E